MARFAGLYRAAATAALGVLTTTGVVAEDCSFARGGAVPGTLAAAAKPCRPGATPLKVQPGQKAPAHLSRPHPGNATVQIRGSVQTDVIVRGR